MPTIENNWRFLNAPSLLVPTEPSETVWSFLSPAAIWTVFDHEENPLENATVQVDGETYTTDANGESEITTLEPGEHEVAVSAAGYPTQRATTYIATQPGIDRRHFVMMRARGIPSLGGLVTRR